MAARVTVWIGDSRRKIRAFPDVVKDRMGHALWEAQEGAMPRSAKPLKGFGGAGVLEVLEDYDGNAYRAVYTVKFRSALYVLHCFQKKSKRGIGTPQTDMALIEQRLKEAFMIEKDRGKS
jgi:phage-related protein